MEVSIEPPAADRTEPNPYAPPPQAPPAKQRGGGSLGKLLRGGIWTLGGRVWIAAAAVIGTACWARVLSHAEMGDYAFAQTLVLYGSICGSLGFGLLTVRLTPAHLAAGRVELARHSISQCLLLSLGGSLLWGALYYVAAPLVFTNYPALMANHLLMTLWLTMVPVSLVMAESFRGMHDIRESVLFGGAAFQAVFISGAVLFAWLTGFDFTAMLMLAVLGAAANLALGYWWLQHRMSQLTKPEHARPTADLAVPHSTKEMLAESLPLMLNLLLATLMLTMDLWIVGLAFTPDDMANYGLAARVVLVIIMPTQIVQGVIPPMISELYQLKKRDELENLLRGTATLAAIPSCLAMLLILTTAQWSIPWIFGADFGPAAWTLMLLTFGQLVSVLVGSANFLLMMTGHQRPAVLCGVAALVVLAGLSALLGWYWGPNGVAVAAGISMTVYKVSLTLVAWRMLGIRCWVDPTLGSVWKLLASRRNRNQADASFAP